MSQYQTPQTELLLALVREANPSMPLPPSSTNMRFGTPVAQSVPPGGIADTNVRAAGLDGYIGTRILQYRRINLANYFRNMTPLPIRIWTATTNVITAAEVAAFCNKFFGLALTAADFNVKTFGPNATTAAAIAPASLCYSGQLVFVWTPSPRNVNDVWTGNSVPGRRFPGGNDFSPGFKPVGEYMCYETDFRILNTTLTGLGASGTWNGSTAAGVAITNFLKANVSPDFKGDQQHTVYGGLNGLAFINVSMPNTGAPEANSSSTIYTKVVAIISQPNSWFRGKLLMHY